MLTEFLSFDFSLPKTVVALLAVGALAGLDLTERLKHRNGHYLFACLVGTVLSVGLIQFTRMLLTPGLKEQGHVVALGLLLIVILWRLLFGPWEPQVKATVLGTFVFWVGLHLLFKEPSVERSAHLFAILVALIPAVVWGSLYLEYHRERRSLVLLMFFAGMLSTAPILFYDALVRHRVELNFFLFRIIPESFSRSAETFVTGQAQALPRLQIVLLSTFLSFLIVGLIEEFSKYWVLRRSAQRAFSSIDDVLQFAVLVAIGFAFAENSANPGYFVTFVKEYLLQPSEPNWAGFFGNVLGRSILTSMVHIVSTGVFGYFLGLALFAGPYLEEDQARGRRHWLVGWIHRILRLKENAIFSRQMLLMGFFFAILLHALSNFLVTLPDLLPGQPRTIGDLFGSSEGSLLHYVSLLLIPSLLYVVGGFWLLTFLFERKANVEERGSVVMIESIVIEEEGEEE